MGRITERLIFEGKPYNYIFNVPTEGTIYWEADEPVTFYLGTEKARETANIRISGVTKLDLHIEDIPPPSEFPWVLTTIIILGIGLVVYVVASKSR